MIPEMADRLPSDRLIVALDFPDSRAALALVDRLHGATRWLKVGLELYIAEGNSLVAELKRRGYSIFLDLKLHDIPNTVASAVRAAARLDVDMLTVHAAGGSEMLTAAVQAAESRLAVLAVTVLTSMDAAQLEATGVMGTPAGQVERLASVALACGVERTGLFPERGGEFAQPFRQRAFNGHPGHPSRRGRGRRSTACGHAGSRDRIRSKLPGSGPADHPGR